MKSRTLYKKSAARLSRSCTFSFLFNTRPHRRRQSRRANFLSPGYTQKLSRNPRGRELSFGFRRNSQPVALGESHFLAVDNGFALAGNNAVYLFVALMRMDERNACAAIGLLVVYCFKDVASSGTYGIPEILSVLLIIVLHKWKKNTLLSIGGDTALYMLLVQTVFK